MDRLIVKIINYIFSICDYTTHTFKGTMNFKRKVAVKGLGVAQKWSSKDTQKNDSNEKKTCIFFPWKTKMNTQGTHQLT